MSFFQDSSEPSLSEIQNAIREDTKINFDDYPILQRLRDFSLENDMKRAFAELTDILQLDWTERQMLNAMAEEASKNISHLHIFMMIELAKEEKTQDLISEFVTAFLEGNDPSDELVDDFLEHAAAFLTEKCIEIEKGSNKGALVMFIQLLLKLVPDSIIKNRINDELSKQIPADKVKVIMQGLEKIHEEQGVSYGKIAAVMSGKEWLSSKPAALVINTMKADFEKYDDKPSQSASH